MFWSSIGASVVEQGRFCDARRIAAHPEQSGVEFEPSDGQSVAADPLRRILLVATVQTGRSRPSPPVSRSKHASRSASCHGQRCRKHRG